MSIRDALDALPQATLGQWKAELCLGGSYVIDNTLPENRGKVRRIAEVYGHLSTPSDARLIAAAPEMAEWIMEAVPQLIEWRDQLRWLPEYADQMAKLDQLIQKAVDD